MLKLIIPENEFYDSRTNKFIWSPSGVLTLEHSLVALAEWESKWHIPFLSAQTRTLEQERDYIRCMLVDPLENEKILQALTYDNLNTIKNYINKPMTATTFSKTTNNRSSKEVITAEIIYYRMLSHNIPMECQMWHLNRLLTLLRVFDVKSSSTTKMSKSETAKRNAELNAARRNKFNTRG